MNVDKAAENLVIEVLRKRESHYRKTFVVGESKIKVEVSVEIGLSAGKYLESQPIKKSLSESPIVQFSPAGNVCPTCQGTGSV